MERTVRREEERKDPSTMIDEVLVRLELVERTASEMARSEGSQGKLLALITMTEEVRDRLRELKVICSSRKAS